MDNGSHRATITVSFDNEDLWLYKSSSQICLVLKSKTIRLKGDLNYAIDLVTKHKKLCRTAQHYRIFRNADRTNVYLRVRYYVGHDKYYEKEPIAEDTSCFGEYETIRHLMFLKATSVVEHFNEEQKTLFPQFKNLLESDEESQVVLAYQIRKTLSLEKSEVDAIAIGLCREGCFISEQLMLSYDAN